MTDTLTTARLTLRRIKMDDVPAMHAIFTDENAMQYWSRLPHTDIAETEAWVAKVSASNESGEGDDFVVIRNGALVGRVGIWQNNEMGLIFAPSVWGTGIAREAIEALIKRSQAGHDLDHGRYRPAQSACAPFFWKSWASSRQGRRRTPTKSETTGRTASI